MIRGYKFFIMLSVFIYVNAGFSSSCPSGYATLGVEKHIDTQYTDFSESTFMAVEGGLCKIGGYALLEIPDDVVAVYNGFVMGTAVTLCDEGYAPNNGACVAYTQGTCQQDDDNLELNSSSFMALDNGLCKIGGYSAKEMPEDVYPVYNGFVMGAEVTLCDNGFQVNNGSCSTYSAGDCPTNYQDILLNSNTMATLTNGSCASGYQTFLLNQQCDENTDDAICGILCTGGLNYTDIGTCAAICPGEHTTLRTSTGLIFPMYSEKQITPSLNIQVGNNVCYVNLVSGASDDAINIKYNNTTYHTVK